MSADKNLEYLESGEQDSVSSRDVIESKSTWLTQIIKRYGISRSSSDSLLPYFYLRLHLFKSSGALFGAVELRHAMLISWALSQ